MPPGRSPSAAIEPMLRMQRQGRPAPPPRGGWRRPLVGARAAAPRRLTHTISMKRTRKSGLCAGGTADPENALWRSFALW
jgi:hypothetical protein